MAISRKDFLHIGASAVLFTIVPRRVLGGKGFVAPSDQMTKGIIGTGNMGRGHYNYGGTRLVALCDVDQNHLDAAVKAAPEVVAAYRDYRDLIKDPNVDIVHIATPPHWHGIMVVEAAAAGKDIWCEKPMTRTIGEGKRIVEAVKQYGNIFRLNTWFRFEDNFYGRGTTVHPIKKL
ncbi:MAG: Gfo/Idh/MocA family oxidoreductase, partial [Bacteroidales bacterium]|nr:Gfo/Idh/MocA family oxidoreductase [Bacteroidales bacterium]